MSKGKKQAARVGDAERNPFPAYPVTSLRGIQADILSATVMTSAIKQAEAAVDAYVAASPGQRRPSLQSVRGDYGTGKTHLLLFARTALEQRSANRAVTISAAATEVDYVGWYKTVLGPALLKIGLSKLMGELLARAGTQVASRAEITTAHADAITKDATAIFTLLREDLISRTAVEDLLQSWIGEIAPGASTELRRALAVLPWQPRAEAAERWLACAPEKAGDGDLLGLTRSLDVENEAVTVLAAIAGLCGLLSRPFAMFIDEFEHLAAFDERNKQRRNATWVKRLIEALAAQNAMIFISGHWMAWEAQQDDFSDRFGGAKPIRLFALSESDVAQLAQDIAPQWASPLRPGLASEIAEGAGGNIRRVLALLRELFSASPKNSSGLSDDDLSRALEAVANFSREASPDRALRILGKICTKEGAVLARDWIGWDGSHYDAAVRRSNDVFLVVERKTAKSPTELYAELHEFAARVAALRRRNPELNGLMLLSGVAEADGLALTNRLQGTTVLSLEDPALELKIAETVKSSLARPDAGPALEGTLDADFEIRSRLSDLRQHSFESSDRVMDALGDQATTGDARRAGIAEVALEELAPRISPEERRRRDIVDGAFSGARAPTVLNEFINRPALIAPFIAAILLGVTYVVPPGPARAETSQSEAVWGSLHPYTIFVAIFLAVAGGAYVCFRHLQEIRGYRAFTRWQFNTLEEMLLEGATELDLVRVRNILSQTPLDLGGYFGAIDRASERISRHPATGPSAGPASEPSSRAPAGGPSPAL